MQVHTGTLQQLATSTYQCNFDHISLVYQYTMEVTEKVSFHGWNNWKPPASIVEGISRQKPKVDQPDLYRM